MCADARNEQEVVGSDFADVLKHLALCSTYHIHHVVGIAPFLTLLQHLLEEALAVSVGRELEVVAALVGSERQENHPLALILQERSHAVLAHVGSHCERVEVDFLEEGAGIHCAGVADVTTLSVCDDEVLRIVLVEIRDSLLERNPALHTHALIEGEVGLVGHAVGCCGVDDSLVEGKDGVFLLQQVLRNLLDVGVETHTQEGLLRENLVNQFFACHIVIYF